MVGTVDNREMIAVNVIQAYLYDIRSGSYLHKLTGHTDTVLAVAFHPQVPQVCEMHTHAQRDNATFNFNCYFVVLLH